MTRAEINAIGTMLASLRHADESTVAVAFAAHAPCTDTRGGSVSATVTKDGHSATSEAVSLDDALRLARAKLDREAAAREKAKSDAKEVML